MTKPTLLKKIVTMWRYFCWRNLWVYGGGKEAEDAWNDGFHCGYNQAMHEIKGDRP
jgi:hypothetical protein